MINCSDIETNLRLYSDGRLTPAENDQVKQHLTACPVCRQYHADLLDVQTSLRRVQRPPISSAVSRNLRLAVAAERRRGDNAWYRLAPDFRHWITTGLMPYSVGVVASLVIGITFLMLLPSGIRQPRIPASYGDTSLLLASNRGPYQDLDLTPTAYAQTRLDVAGESPSINPQGALVALTKSLVRGGMKDDEVVVVADVFGNGLAQITDVVEPSRHQRAVAELQKALETDPAFAPFVPSAMDNRSETVKVVLRLQSVDVQTSARRTRRQ